MKNQKPITTKTLTDKEKLFAEQAAENYYASETKPDYQLAIEAGYADLQHVKEHMKILIHVLNLM